MLISMSYNLIPKKVWNIEPLLEQIQLFCKFKFFTSIIPRQGIFKCWLYINLSSVYLNILLTFVLFRLTVCIIIALNTPYQFFLKPKETEDWENPHVYSLRRMATLFPSHWHIWSSSDSRVGTLNGRFMLAELLDLPTSESCIMQRPHVGVVYIIIGPFGPGTVWTQYRQAADDMLPCISVVKTLIPLI